MILGPAREFAAGIGHDLDRLVLFIIMQQNREHIQSPGERQFVCHEALQYIIRPCIGRKRGKRGACRKQWIQRPQNCYMLVFLADD